MIRIIGLMQQLSDNIVIVYRDDTDEDAMGSYSSGRKSPYRMSLDNRLQSVPENQEVIRDPGVARPETLLEKLLALEGSEAVTENDVKEKSLEESIQSEKTVEDMSYKPRINQILRSQSLSKEEPEEEETKKKDLRKDRSYSINTVNGFNSGDLMDELKTCEDFVSFKNATVILLTRMHEEIEELNRKLNSSPAASHAPPPPAPPPPPPAPALTAPPLTLTMNKKASWRKETELKIEPANFLLDEIRKKQESRNKRTSLKSKYEKLGSSSDK